MPDPSAGTIARCSSTPRGPARSPLPVNGVTGSIGISKTSVAHTPACRSRVGFGLPVAVLLETPTNSIVPIVPPFHRPDRKWSSRALQGRDEQAGPRRYRTLTSYQQGSMDLDEQKC